MSMFLRNTGSASSARTDEGQPASVGARANVLRLPGPCQRWDEQDADFIREILDLVGDKWSVLVIGALAAGDARYSDLDAAIPAISRRMLTLTLKRLQRSGLVDRTSYPEVPPRVEYSLTSLGASLLAAIENLAAWSAEQHAEIRRHQDAYDASETRERAWREAERTAVRPFGPAATTGHSRLV